MLQIPRDQLSNQSLTADKGPIIPSVLHHFPTVQVPLSLLIKSHLIENPLIQEIDLKSHSILFNYKTFYIT